MWPRSNLSNIIFPPEILLQALIGPVIAFGTIKQSLLKIAKSRLYLALGSLGTFFYPMESELLLEFTS